jgi:hypothetical protein
MPKAGRKRKAPVTLAAQAIALGATPRRAAQAGDNIEVVSETNNSERGATFVRLADWPLAMLAKRRSIDPIQEAAGDKYFEDCYNAGQIPSGAMDYAKDKVDTSITDHTPEFRLDALDRFTKAAKVNGPMVAPIVDAVCLEGKPIALVAGHSLMRQNKRDREAQVIWTLVIGLDNLARHFGMKR